MTQHVIRDVVDRLSGMRDDRESEAPRMRVYILMVRTGASLVTVTRQGDVLAKPEHRIHQKTHLSQKKFWGL